MLNESTIDRITARFGSAAVVTSFRDNHRLTCTPDAISDMLEFLKNQCGMDMLVDITAVDYLDYPGARDRFAVIYCLASTATAERLIAKVFVNDPAPTVPSAVRLWKGADWLEREVYDMFGIRFAGHPDLRRILLPDEFAAYPLRKDYPLRGRGERHNFPVYTRSEG